MQGSRLSGILTVGVVTMGVLWYFNSRPSGDSDPNPNVPVTEQLPAPEVATVAETKPTGFRPRGSQILVLDRNGLPAEALQNGAWNPVLDLDEPDDRSFSELQNNAEDFGDLAVQTVRQSMTGEVAALFSAPNGAGPGSPVRLASSSSSSSSAGGSGGGGSTAHKGVAFDPEELIPPVETGDSPDPTLLLAFNLIAETQDTGSGSGPVPPPSDLPSGLLSLQPPHNSVPEPSTMLLLATGLVASSYARRKQRKADARPT